MHTSNQVELTEELLNSLSNKKVLISDEDNKLVNRIFNYVAFTYSKSVNSLAFQTEIGKILDDDIKYGGEYLERLRDMVDFYGGTFL